MKLEYVRKGDYLYPNLIIESTENRPIVYSDALKAPVRLDGNQESSGKEITNNCSAA